MASWRLASSLSRRLGGGCLTRQANVLKVAYVVRAVPFIEINANWSDRTPAINDNNKVCARGCGIGDTAIQHC